MSTPTRPPHDPGPRADEATERHLLDVAYRTVDSPFGALLLAATPHGLARIAFEREGHDAVLARLAADISPRVVHAPDRLDEAAGQLDGYFAGRRRRFDVAVDLRLARGFRRAVLQRLGRIGYGATTTYGTLAADLGRPGAARAVGTACATNPVSIVVPCHRVVRGDGVIGDYLGGTEMKRALLALEAA
jgi:methylated-DNA-[protein]-cysteine S-methyltransferase